MSNSLKYILKHEILTPSPCKEEAIVFLNYDKLGLNASEQMKYIMHAKSLNGWLQTSINPKNIVTVYKIAREVANAS